MDSLSQIVLGAAVGEAVLGRRIGNRAMVWGGLAGTLPDLDVLSGLVADPMSALAYHRAFTHSLPFALLAAPLIGLAVNRIYGGVRRFPLPNRWFFPLLLLLFWVLLMSGSYLMPVEVYAIPAITGAITLVFGGMCSLVALYELRKSSTPVGQQRQLGLPATVGWGRWTLLFFLAIVTHPLLDCFTAYGTQFFEPFSAFRISWNTISVVDPLYTLPFLFLLIAAGRRCKDSRVRRQLNRAGLFVSSTYLLLTAVNAIHVGRVVTDSLGERGLTARRSFHSPNLGNNLLWSATAETSPGAYHCGQYSLLDEERTLQPLQAVLGRHELLADYHGQREVDILRWFTDGYYTVLPLGEGRVQFCDLRYGLLGTDPENPNSYIFSWVIDTTRQPVRVVEQRAGPQQDRGEMLGRMWDRIWGI